MSSFQMASYAFKRFRLSSQSLVIFLLLVACFEKTSEADTATTDSSPNATTQSPPESSTDSTTTATTKATINGNCASNKSCSVGFCESNVCKCINTQYYNGSSCVNKIAFGYPCNETNQCENTTDCIIQDGLKVCGCNSTHFSNDNITCQMKKEHMQECVKNSAENVCLNQTMCYNNLNGNSTTYCLCSETFFWHENTCLPNSNLRVTNVTVTKTEYTINITWIPVPYNVTYAITSVPNVTSPTTGNNYASFSELISGTNYSFSISTNFQVNILFYKGRSEVYNLNVITDPARHGGKCNGSNSECVPGTACIRDKQNQLRCLCNSSQYWNNLNSSCLSIQVITPTSVEAGTKFIYYQWSSINDKSNNISYSISVDGNKINANSTNGNVTNLTPGIKYTIYFITEVLEDQYYSNNSLNSSTQTWTKPAKPQSFNYAEIDNNTLKYNISFAKSEGEVLYFSLNLSNENDQSDSIQKNQSGLFFIVENLKPVTNYRAQIRAYNGNNDSSEVLEGNLKTSASPSEMVFNLSIDNIGNVTAQARWQEPKKTNGNITAYNAYLKTKSECIAAYLKCIGSCNQGVYLPDSCPSPWNSSIRLQNNSLIEMDLLNLQPYTEYTLTVYAINNAGKGEDSSKNFTTKVGAPIQVKNLIVIPTKGQNIVGFNVTWTPGDRTGPTNYSICINQNLTDIINQACALVYGYEITFYYFPDLLAFWNYSVNVTVITEIGTVTSQTYEMTLENTLGMPSFTLEQDKEIANKVTIVIVCPEKEHRNGTVERYTIRYTALKEDWEQNATEISGCKEPLKTQLTNIGVEKDYYIKVRAMNKNGPGIFTENKTLTVNAKKPLKAQVSQSLMTQNDFVPTQTKVGVWICPDCLKDNKQGNVTLTGLIVCVKATASKVCFSNGKKRRAADMQYELFSPWSTAQKDGFKSDYRATPTYWLSGINTNFTYIVGDNATCKSDSKEFCNGPLPSDKEIVVRVFVCNRGGCEDSDLIGLRTAVSENSDVAAIVGGVVGGILGLALIVAIVVVLIWYMRRPKRPYPTSPFWDMDSESKKREHIKDQRPIKIYEFKDHVIRLHKDSNLLFQDEFEDIKKLSARFTHTSEKAKEESNRVKNRYVDILPYDHSRVKLDIQPEDDDSMDFINANFIPGYNSVREYIATQGPMHYTIPDFWRMTWEQKSKVIVMLSDLQEQGKRKVDLYWPENLNEPINYGNIIVEMTNFSQLNKYIIRNFKITRGSETRRITHFFLPGWWDFSANLTTEDVLEFAKLVRQEATPANSGPIIVHCSAGVGRTGTFIALDYFMQYIDKHSLMDSVDIFSYVMKMRYNRPRMVQAETQYIFIFDALEEIITKKIKDEEEKMAEHTYGNGNIYANVTVKPPEESIYANSEPVKDKNDKNAYDNQAFEMEYQNMDLSQSKKDNPTTVL